MNSEVPVERRRRSDDGRIEELLETVSRMAKDLTAVKEKQDDLTERFNAVEQVTNSIHTVSKVFNGVERGAVWITKIAAVVAIVGAAWKYGIMQIGEALGLTSGGKS